ncbi:MAG: hypothetical protein M1838_004359 [Thelocarpon superellum]|nr:MAG: hypothetical protein M1838_004359 [Thelocarpon superellum]
MRPPLDLIFPPAPTFTERSVGDLSGKVVMITGAASGAGLELARLLYGKSATVYVVARSLDRVNQAIELIHSSAPDAGGRLMPLVMDLAELQTIKPAVQQFLDQESRLDVLVHNAGVMMPPAGSKTKTGHDLELATNCLGPFVLSRLMESILRRTASSGVAPPHTVRVVWVSSMIHTYEKGIEFDARGDPRVQAKAMDNYMQTKVGQVFLATKEAERLGPDGVTCVSLHPGLMRTELQRHLPGPARVLMGLLFKSPRYGAYTELYAAFSPSITEGEQRGFVVPWGRSAELPRHIAHDVSDQAEGGSGSAQRFWDFCERTTSTYSESDLDEEDSMARPGLLRLTDGRSHLPLLHDDEDRGRQSYDDHDDAEARAVRRAQLRSRSPTTAAKLASTKKYTYAAGFLVLSLISFVIQTETAVYIQHTLGWNKAYCMLYMTHGSWALLWPTQLLILKAQKPTVPWRVFWRQHVHQIRKTAQMVQLQELHPSPRAGSPVPYMLKMTAFVTTALTIAGGSWYVAVNLTTASDLTAIYNCSAFFAYAFSIPLLKEKLRLDKAFAVAVAIIGVLVVAYGDTAPTKHGGKSGGSVGGGPDPDNAEGKFRTLGNVVIGVGSVLYGLYEVLYKKLACPPEGTSPGRGMIFANTFGTMIGSFTLLVLWIPLPILHLTGLERFELPHGEAAWMMLISVLANATFSGSFLVLISLTSPVLSSVAALLTIFLVAIVDWFLTGEPLSAAAIAGGVLIIAAFLLLSWSTYREMDEEKRKKLEADMDDIDSED